MVLCHTQDSRWWRALTLYKDAVGVSYSPSRLGFENMVIDGRLVALNQISLDDSKKPGLYQGLYLSLQDKTSDLFILKLEDTAIDLSICFFVFCLMTYQPL